jgi:hypothetical protein
MKKELLIFIAFGAFVLLAFQFRPIEKVINTVKESIETPSLVNQDSLTISSRVNMPNDYKRVAYPIASFQEALRRYKLKPFGSRIINYDNSEYFWQGGHIGILDVPVPKNGLQQCADALIRIRSE